MISIPHWVVALVCLILFLIFLHHGFSRTQPKLPPSPPRFPVLGNLHQLGVYPHRSLQSLSKRYGPLMLLHLGSVPVLVVSSADAARQVMKDNDLVFSNRPKSSLAEKLLYAYKDVSFAPYGEFWRQIRSICVIQLLSTKRVQSFRPVREQETSLLVEKVRDLSSSTQSINLSDLLMQLTNDIVCRVALGRKYGVGEDGKRFKLLLREFVEVVGTFYVGDYIPWLGWVTKVNGFDVKVERIAKRFDEFLESVVEEHRRDRKKAQRDCEDRDEGGSDFVDILLEIQRDNETGISLETDVIKALILDVFAAGTDTTYSVLEWTMTELLRHPEIMEKLQNEVRQVAGRNLEITEDDLEKMHYLKAVIKETLRLHIPIPLLVPRESIQSAKIMGYDIHAGTQVIVNAWAIGRDPSSWENPEEFRPERFSGTTIDFKGLNFELIPFGAGRRGCPAATFAIAINELALAKLVHKFDFALPNRGRETDLDMTESTGLTIHKKFPLLIEATPHSF